MLLNGSSAFAIKDGKPQFVNFMHRDDIIMQYLHYLLEPKAGAVMMLWHLLHDVEFIHLSRHNTQGCLIRVSNDTPKNQPLLKKAA